MRTLDDFAFVKEAGFEKLYNSISETLSLYNEDLLKIYCGQFRNPLDCAIQAIYYLAKIKDAIVPKGLSGDNIGRLRQVLPVQTNTISISLLPPTSFCRCARRPKE